MADEQYEAAIRRAIAKRRAETPEQREQIYAAARESFQRTGRAAEELDALDAAIKAIESTFHKAPAVSTMSPWKRYWIVPAFVAAIGAGIGAGYLLSATQAGPNTIDEPAFAQRYFERTYRDQANVLEAAFAYLRELSDEIVRRQRNDRESLARSEKAFVLLSTYDAALAKKMPASLPPGTTVTLRATPTDFKILLNWTLCGMASVSHPEMVDKVRNTVATIGCPYFGVWTPGATNW